LIPAPLPSDIENIGEKENDDSISIDSVETINSQYEINYNNENESIAPSQNCHPILIDPVLIDINEVTTTGHEILRENACQDLQIYTDKMINQMSIKKKWPNRYEIGELVRIAIPKINHSGIDRPMLPCKIVEVTENNNYLLGSKFGIINVYYSPGEIEPLSTMHFPELENLPSNKISVREAARLQSTGPVTGAICNCKGNCDNSRCRCKKVGKNCGSRCHNGHSCQNKEN